MKRALTLILALALASCASPRRASAPGSNISRADSGGRFEQPPAAGMTKAQALARYGKPRKRILTESGERWYYLLNAGEVRRKTLNPLSLTVPKYRTGILLFDASGKVKKFVWEAKSGR